MKTTRFFPGVLLGFGLVACGWTGLVMKSAGEVDALGDWLIQLTERKKAIAQEQVSPRIFLVGGSSVLMGFRGDVLSAELGVPSLNFGIYAGLNTDVYGQILEDLVQPGDVVVLTLEYEFFNMMDGTEEFPEAALERFNSAVVKFFVLNDPEYLRALPWNKQLEVVMRYRVRDVWDGVRRWVRGRLPEPTPDHYNVRHLNAFGDFTGMERESLTTTIAPEHAFSRTLVTGISDQTAAWGMLDDFLERMRRRGVTVVATFPNIMSVPVYEQPAALAVFQQITDYYRERGVVVLGTPQEAMFPEEWFYDTYYHLTDSAAQERTKRWVEQHRAKLLELVRH